MSVLESVFLNQTGKIDKRAIIRLFRLIGKTAARKLAVFQVIAQAVTADAFTRTGLITAVAAFKVDSLFALHKSLSPNLRAAQVAMAWSMVVISSCSWNGLARAAQKPYFSYSDITGSLE